MTKTTSNPYRYDRCCPPPEGRIDEQEEYRTLKKYKAYNPKTPIDTLRELAKDEDFEVRAQVAENSGIPHDVFVLLSKDKIYEVKQKMLFNPNVPPDVLDTMARSIHRPEYRNLRVTIARHPCTTTETLDFMSTQVSPSLRRAVAGNPNCLQYTLTRLAQDSKYDVRRAVISNTEVTLPVLLTILDYERFNHTPFPRNAIIELFQHKLLPTAAILVMQTLWPILLENLRNPFRQTRFYLK